MLLSFLSLFFAWLYAQPTVASAVVTSEVVAARDFPPGLSVPTFIGPYGYLGCFTDSAPTRALSALTGTAPSIEVCAAICNSHEGYFNLAYVGLEFGSECYCDWALQNTAVQVDDSECNVPCVGNPSEPCGGPNRLTVVALGSSPVSAIPIISENGHQWEYQGCFHDSQTAKVFPTRAIIPDTRFFTLEVCSTACRTAGFPYAGIEFRNECWCGTAEQLATAVVGPDSDCGMACVFDFFERCGGPDRMSVYKQLVID